MKRILFLIHDLAQGGAEKVLVNLVNNMDHTKYDVTVLSLFGGGINEQFLSKDVRLINCFKRPIRGNSHIMKLFTPKQLYNYFIKEHYDIVVSYLEGPCARIVSGCTDQNTKIVSWIHIEQKNSKRAAASFRNYAESMKCYSRFDKIICVSDAVKKDFLSIYPMETAVDVLYNTNESEQIMILAKEPVSKCTFHEEEFKIIGVGKILSNKGFDRLARIHKRLKDEGYPVHTYILGIGPQQEEIEKYLKENKLTDSYTFLGYQINPYKYVAKSDLFVCASHAEGFSTAATEALIVETPVCTVEVSGMREMLGDNGEWGIITKNDEESLYEGIKRLIDDPKLLNHYKNMASVRRKIFSTEKTVYDVEEMFESLCKKGR